MPDASPSDASRTPPTCPCGHDRYSHWARPHAKYGLGASLLLMSGATGTPKEITFRCGRCGALIEHTTDPKVLREFENQ